VDIGDRMRTARKAAGLTQEEVARKTDMSLRAVGDIERGLVPDPHISSLRQIARALGVPVELLIKEENQTAVPFSDVAPEDEEVPGRGKAEEEHPPEEEPEETLLGRRLSEEELEEFIPEAEKVIAITMENLDWLIRQVDLQNLTLEEAKARAEEMAEAILHKSVAREGQEI
jgi:transcriptional regulator with XRE-family HTH domain